MFQETSYENLFFTESWPASTSIIKGNFSKSFNSLCNMKMKSFSNLSNTTSPSSNSLSSSCSSSHSYLHNSNNIIESTGKLNLFTSQESLLDVIEEEEE